MAFVHAVGASSAAALSRTPAFGAGVAVLERLASADPRLLSVLTYHRIADPDEIDDCDRALVSATPAEFARQMDFLAETRRVVELDAVLEARRDGGSVAPGAVLLTFDDAYEDFARVAWPILRERGLPVTLFVPTAYPDGGAPFWWDRLHRALALADPPRADEMNALRERVAALPHDEALALVDEVVAELGEPPHVETVCGWDELRRLAREGVTLAPHSRTHPRLDRVDGARARDEIFGSIADLDREIGTVPPAFAYPGGGCTPDVAAILAEAGIELAFTTARGRNDLRNPDWLALRRANVGRRANVPLLRVQLAAPPRPAPPAGAVDLDVRGLARIRLVGGSPDDVAAVERQLGIPRSAARGKPDVTVRFTDAVERGRPAVVLGAGDAAFTDDAFLVLRGARKARTRVRIPFESIGSGPELVCEHGVGRVPLLVAILNLTIVGRGILPLHAAAFEYEGRGVVATGWSKGGKTELLLGLAARGARYVGDEWVYVDVDRGEVRGLPEDVRVWDWHLRAAPRYRRAIGRRERARLGLLRAAAAAAGWLPPRVGRLIDRQRGLDVPPGRLFGEELDSMPFDRLVFVASHDSADVAVEPVDPLDVARRAAFSLRYERREFIAYYDAFRFAFPDLRSALVEEADELERRLLERAFAGKPAFSVRHPYPVPIERVAAAAARALEGS